MAFDLMYEAMKRTIEQEEWKDQIHPCNTFYTRIENIIWRWSLSVKHPCWKVGKISYIGTKNHRKYGDTSEDIYCGDASVSYLSHNYLSMTLV